MLRRDSTTDGGSGLKCSSWARSSLAGSRSLRLDLLVRDPSKHETSHHHDRRTTFHMRTPVAAGRRANPVPTLASTRAGVTKPRAVESDQVR